jgi:ribosome maturation factor RimP
LDRDAQIAALHDLVTPALASLGLELFDLYFSGSGRGRMLRVSVERDGAGGGVDLDTIALASQAITPLLDNEPTLTGSYVLEVTSPGVERPLRVPSHFRRAIGETVSVKYRTDEGSQRVRGTLVAAGDDLDHIDLDIDGVTHRIAFADITDARTVFEWGPSPRPGKKRAQPKEKTRS